MSYRSDMMLICTEDVYEHKGIKDQAKQLGEASWHYEDMSYHKTCECHGEIVKVHVMTWKQAPTGHDSACGILKTLEEMAPTGLYRLLVNGESDDDAYIRTNDDGFFNEYQIGFIYPHMMDKQTIRFGNSQATGIMKQIRALSEELLSYGSGSHYLDLTDAERELVEECANMVNAISALQ